MMPSWWWWFIWMRAVSINMKFYGASKGDLGANVPKHADYLFHVPQLFGTGHFDGENAPFLLFFCILVIFGILVHALAQRPGKVTWSCTFYSRGERVMAKRSIKRRHVSFIIRRRQFIIRRRHNEQEMEIRDTCQPCLQLYVCAICHFIFSYQIEEKFHI